MKQNNANNRKENLFKKCFIVLSIFFSCLLILGFIGFVKGDSLYDDMIKKNDPNQVSADFQKLSDQQIKDNWISLVNGQNGVENPNKFLGLLDKDALNRFSEVTLDVKKVDLEDLKLKYEDKQLKTKEGTPLVPHKKLESIKVNGNEIKSTYNPEKGIRDVIVNNGAKGYIEDNNYVREGKVLANVLGRGKGGEVGAIEENGNTKFEASGKDIQISVPEKTDKKIPEVMAFGSDKKSSLQVNENGFASEVSGKIKVMRMKEQQDIPMMTAGSGKNLVEYKEEGTVFLDSGEKSLSLVFDNSKVDGDFVRIYDKVVDEKTGTAATNIEIKGSDITLYPLASMSSKMSINDISVALGSANIKIVSQQDLTDAGKPWQGPAVWQTFVSFNEKDIWIPKMFSGSKDLRFMEDIKSGEGDGYTLVRYGSASQGNPGWELNIQDSQKLQNVLDQIYSSGTTSMNRVDVKQIPSVGPQISMTPFQFNNPTQTLTQKNYNFYTTPSSSGSSGGIKRERVGGIIFFPKFE